MILVLSEQNVKAVLGIKDAIDVVEQAFFDFDDKNIEMPSRIGMIMSPSVGVFSVMPAFFRGSGALGIKIVTHYPHNQETYGYPATQANVLYYDSKNGHLLAIMGGSYLTAIRTAATSAVAAKYLARNDSKIVGIIGSGIQAEAQLEAICCVKPIELARVYSPNSTHRHSFAQKMSKKLEKPIVETSNAYEAVKGADIVITATSCSKPVISGDWLGAGVSVISIGSGFPDWRELDDAVITKSKIVADSVEAATRESGDFIIPIKKGIMTKEDIHASLAEIVQGKKSGRKTSQEITLFKSVGLAHEDVATAKFVYEQAKSRSVGVAVEL